MGIQERLKDYWERCLKGEGLERRTPSWVLLKMQCHEKRGARVVRVTAEGAPYRSLRLNNGEQQIDYALYVTFFIQQGDHYYIEEEQRDHRAIFKGNELLKDEALPVPKEEAPPREALTLINEEGTLWREDTRSTYDRQKAVQYANLWWNTHNPAYRHFTDDCTNFISQCLKAGGAPMWGSPHRGKGWWYNYKVWSYSWTVANAMRWYLSGAKQGVKGREVERASDLILGDIICYDFEGDGRWNHTTIVVGKDAFGEPLVNAHTSNSYHRYWDYEDSTAYTPNIQYKFFRIGE
ncbi:MULTISPECIES: amidase domain-containing protein [Pontibacillus]|uniref:Amidase domain-containing protein n=1 Tax=Pontibacillus chungwhensis TaxID=265426 RepID=A0ABY8V283_9BACI|nr:MULTISPECIES: amidase domain-containing protein [Pontibacillus]MCD5324735.1 amidase domain-containing protein [Pontibacillus sp. HN14]WIF98694.1 amidase domain-containing protein [Pontibacillus chungwhensis]